MEYIIFNSIFKIKHFIDVYNLQLLNDLFDTKHPVIPIISNLWTFWNCLLEMAFHKYILISWYLIANMETYHVEIFPEFGPIMGKLKYLRITLSNFWIDYNEIKLLKIFIDIIWPYPKLFVQFFFSFFSWAVSTVMTRQNTIPSLDGGNMINALIPLWDMCNHTNGTVSDVRPFATLYSLKS